MTYLHLFYYDVHFFPRLLVRKDASLLRDMRILSYFRQCFPSDLDISTIKELARALASHRPYEVPIASVKIQHLQCVVGSNLLLVCHVIFCSFCEFYAFDLLPFKTILIF